MKKFIAALIIFFVSPEIIYAHGVGYRESQYKSIALEFFYSTGEKMSYREAKVFSPNDNKFAAQTGRTDEQGRFAFIPDVDGEWRVIVRDEEGHQCEAKINVLGSKPEIQNHDINNDLFVRALLGVSIIFNIAMIILVRRKNCAHK